MQSTKENKAEDETISNNFKMHGTSTTEMPRYPFENTQSKLESYFVGSNLKNERLIRVLFWTNYYGAEPLTAVNNWFPVLPLPVAQCDVRCQFTQNRDFLPLADAVVFHSPNINRSDLPRYHREDQIWIYLEEEPPTKSRWDLEEIPQKIFNWTMTYRSDSDVYHPYGEIIQNSHPVPTYLTNPMKHYLINKPKLAAWTSSNCLASSKREELIMELRKHIPVDIYGRCGNFLGSIENAKCIKSWPDGCFGEEIEKQYKFYFAFENSLCEDYVTEKFFNALSYGIIPVVYGAANYSSIAPPGSYINIKDFATPKQFADYLLYLANNPTAYLAYFQWKDYFRIVHKGTGYCRLCHILKDRYYQQISKHFNPNFEESKQWYLDIRKWWSHKDASGSIFKVNVKNNLKDQIWNNWQTPVQNSKFNSAFKSVKEIPKNRHLSSATWFTKPDEMICVDSPSRWL